MRSKVVRTLALALALACVSFGMAQQPVPPTKPNVPGMPSQGGKPAPEKSKLESMLAEALKNNPDIRVAAAKLAVADAELYRTRLQVTQKIVALHEAILSQKAATDLIQKEYDRSKKRYEQKIFDAQTLDQVRVQLVAAKAKLSELESQIPALLGHSSRKEAEVESRRTWQDAAFLEQYYQRLFDLSQTNKVQGPLAERIRKALQTPIKVDYKDMTFDAILNDMSKKVDGLSFRNLNPFRGLGVEGKVNLRFEEALPLSAILQALSDETGYFFFVREYGIVATTGNGAPHGAMTVEQFLRQKPADEPRRQATGGKNPPAKNVEGLVKNTDSSGLMTLTIGSDAGLAKGHTLELFRLNPATPSQSKYLGTVRILEADAHQAVAQPISRLKDAPQAGDRVISRMVGK